MHLNFLFKKFQVHICPLPRLLRQAIGYRFVWPLHVVVTQWMGPMGHLNGWLAAWNCHRASESEPVGVENYNIFWEAIDNNNHSHRFNCAAQRQRQPRYTSALHGMGMPRYEPLGYGRGE